MPLTLVSTRALRGEKRRWTLVVMGHGRWPYLRRALDSIDLTRFDRWVLSIDGDFHPREVWEWMVPAWAKHPWDLRATGSRQGLTANMAQALGALNDTDEWVFWLEEDFVIHDWPLDEMADALEAFSYVANMVLLRQPWNEAEKRHGSVYPTIPGGLTDRGGWLEHTAGFWLNPMVSHASLLRTLQPGVESDLTAQCRARDLKFGYWGSRNDPPRCEHIGVEGGMGSPGWLR